MTVFRPYQSIKKLSIDRHKTSLPLQTQKQIRVIERKPHYVQRIFELQNDFLRFFRKINEISIILHSLHSIKTLEIHNNNKKKLLLDYCYVVRYHENESN